MAENKGEEEYNNAKDKKAYLNVALNTSMEELKNGLKEKELL